MQKQLGQIHSQEQNKLTISSGVNTALILNEQPDKAEAVQRISMLLDKIAKLWQIPNWTVENSVLLAGWTFETYRFEPLEVVLRCLNNPPARNEKTWRLTPEVIQEWMSVVLDEEAVKREREHNKTKALFKEALPDVDYESFKKRIDDGTAMPEKPKHWSQDPKYKESKEQYLKSRNKG